MGTSTELHIRATHRRLRLLRREAHLQLAVLDGGASELLHRILRFVVRGEGDVGRSLDRLHLAELSVWKLPKIGRCVGTLRSKATLTFAETSSPSDSSCGSGGS